MAKGATKLHPPELTIGQGGPAAPVIAEELRAKRDHASAKLAAVRVKQREKRGEEHDQEISILVDQIRKLSDEIRKAEAPKS